MQFSDYAEETFAGFPRRLPDILTQRRQSSGAAGSPVQEDAYILTCVRPLLLLAQSVNEALPEISHLAHGVNSLPADSQSSSFKPGVLHLSFAKSPALSTAITSIKTSCALHLIITPEGLGFGAGLKSLTPAQEKNYNAAMQTFKASEKWYSALDSAQAGGCFLETSILPNSQTRKQSSGLMVRNRNEVLPAAIFSSAFTELVVQRFSSLLPFLTWLQEYVEN